MQRDIPLQHNTHLVGRDLGALDGGDSFDNSRRHLLAHGGLSNTTRIDHKVQTIGVHQVRFK